MHFVLKDESVLRNWAYMNSRRRTKSQPVTEFFSILGGGENCVKAIVLIRDKVIANRTCIRSEGKLGVWGLPPENVFEATPSRTSEKALLESRI